MNSNNSLICLRPIPATECRDNHSDPGGGSNPVPLWLYYVPWFLTIKTKSPSLCDNQYRPQPYIMIYILLSLECLHVCCIRKTIF